MNYTLDYKKKYTVYVHTDSVIDDLFNLFPLCNEFVFDKGNYYLNDTLVINKNNITLRSTSKNPVDVHIYQNNSGEDSISIKDCSNVKIVGLSIHNGHDGKIPLTLGGISNTKVSNCYIYGNKNSFTVYYAGPTNLTEGISTVNAYNNKNLDSNNVFKKNVVYTYWSGDCIAFCLQKNGTFSGNIVRGGKVAIYMCSNVNVTDNVIYDSKSNGLYLSLPSDNIKISNNKIYECEASGIKISSQGEHGEFVNPVNNIIIDGNKIYDSRFYAIELNYVDTISINKNNFISTDNYGIYVYSSKNITIKENIVSYFTVALWFEISNDADIQNNIFNVVYPQTGKNLLKSLTSNNIIFNNNSINGHIDEIPYAVDANCTNVNTDNNTFKEFYTYDDELKIIKF